MNKSTLL